MARILVTGADGFTGRHLIQRLAADGHELHGLVHRAGREGQTQLTATHVGDLRDLSALSEIVARVQPDKVVHLAAIAFVAHGNASELYSANIFGTRNLLQALVTASHAPQAVLLASSANVYGNRREGVLDESVSAEPANDYGITKLSCEMLGKLYADRLPIITVRPFNYTGRGQSEQFIIPKIVAHAKARSDFIELGNINVARDFSDVRTVVDSYARLLDAPQAIGGLFNVCSGEARTLGEVLNLAAELMGHRMDVRVNPAFVRPDEVRMLCGSRDRLESVIGEVAMPSLKETLAWMFSG
jgi:nucleoside-diphosphate-sugar epimerase